MLNVVNDQSLKYLRGPLCIWRATAHAHTHWMRISLRKCTSCLVLASGTQAFLSKSTCSLLFVLLVNFYSPLFFGRHERVWALFPRFVSDLKRSKVRGHPLIPGEAPFAVLSPIDNYIGYY